MMTADQIVREFHADVMAAHGNDFEEAHETLKRDWPDLAVTFQHAKEYLDRAD